MKYRRQPKIYQNDYIVEIQQKCQPFEFRSCIDPDDQYKKILFLFFSVRNQVYMLLGRDDNYDNGSNSQINDHTGSVIDHISKTSSQMADQMKEQDDDSPYFLKITLDNQFLSELEEPSLGEPSEILGRCDILIENDVFKEIVRDEIDQMFGNTKSEKKQTEPPAQLEQRPNAEAGAADANELDMNHLKKLQVKSNALDSINMLKIAEHINEDSSEHRSLEKGQNTMNADAVEKVEKDGGDHNAASPPRSRQSDADVKKTTSHQLKSKDSQPQL